MDTRRIEQDVIVKRIFIFRGQKVMLDRDLAELYGVETRRLNEQVKRNVERFPKDFMFQLSDEEMQNWMSQIAISNKERMGIRKRPYAFTEQGVAMLSSVLRSKQAIQVNIAIMRVFIKFREILSAHKELMLRLEKLENKVGVHDKEIQAIFQAIRRLIAEPPKPKSKIGFHSDH